MLDLIVHAASRCVNDTRVLGRVAKASRPPAGLWACGEKTSSLVWVSVARGCEILYACSNSCSKPHAGGSSQFLAGASREPAASPSLVHVVEHPDVASLLHDRQDQAPGRHTDFCGPEPR